MKLPEVILKKGRNASLERRHPWIFSGAIQKLPADLKPGDRVAVISPGQGTVAIGHYLGGNIAVKILSFDKDTSFDDALRDALREAIERRRALGLFDNPRTSAFRLIHGEGDSLPGLIVDLYGSTAVAQFQSPGMAREQDLIADALCSLLPERIEAVFRKSQDAEEKGGKYLKGEKTGGAIFENGLHFRVDWEAGQKTGFFLDQRENRRLLSEMAQGRCVLNLFSYTGGFSISALAGGAKSAVSVDSSAPALELAQENASLNGFSAAHAIERADCFDRAAALKGEFDLIVCDPPALAKHKSALRNGEKAYVTLNQLVLKGLPPNGLLFTFSCSQLISRARFRELLFEASLRVGRRTVILNELHQAPCHPVSLFCPESEYLKGLVLLVN